MYSINRQVAIIKPKAPYQDWINLLSDIDEPCNIENLQNDCTAILLPHFDDDRDSLKYIKSIYPKIFELELDSWSSDKRAWPKNRNYSLFCKWFKIELHSEVLDFEDGYIEKEDY